MASEELEKVAENGNALVSQEELAALQAQQEQEFGDLKVMTPILKIGESLTREVQAGDAEVGEFINTLTGESLGDKIEFVVSYYQQGRLAHDKKAGRTYVAFTHEIPEAWADFVGEEFVGTPFSEYPDAEEQFKQRVNAKEIEWGTGPLISTTHNFTGLAIVPVLDEEGEPTGENDLQQVRLSLKRTNTSSAKKIVTLYRSWRNRPFWEKVFEFGTQKKDYASGPSHLLTVKVSRNSTDEEKLAAAELAQAVAAGRVQDNAAAAESQERPAEAPDAAGGLAV